MHLRILILDDNRRDAELEVAALEETGFTCEYDVVATRNEFLRKLEAADYDLILSDYSLPQFDGVSALKLVTERKLETPFVLISGTVGEEVAIECLKAGATDYVLKTRLSRLALVVTRAVQEKEEQRKRKQAEEALRSSEEQLRQSQKMDAVGRLAGGIAHDFNNLLMVMMGYTELLLEHVPAGHGLRDYAHEIWNAGQKASLVTQQLLAFSRKEPVAPKVLNLNHVTAEMGKLLPRLIGEDIHLEVVLGPQLGNIKADPGHIEQVLMNLVVNARDAMPKGGQMRVETANVSWAAGDSARPAAIPAGDYIRLSVSDSGSGIPPQVMARIFEPFFTTKGVGKGTGLGLATVYGIVQQSNGHILVNSEVTKGSTFSLFFPLVKEKTEAAPTPAMAAAAKGGKETILLVEDEEGVRSLVLAVLQSKGYNVIEAGRPQDALDLSKKYPGKIDLLLTDFILPQMSGRELAEELLREHADLKMLFMSGYTDDKLVQQGGFFPSSAFLQKPFSTEVLANRVRELLDSATNSTPVAAPVRAVRA